MTAHEDERSLIARLLRDQAAVLRGIGIAVLTCTALFSYKAASSGSLQETADYMICGVVLGLLVLIGALLLRAGLRDPENHPLLAHPERIDSVAIEYLTKANGSYRPRLIITMNAGSVVVLSPPADREEELARWLRMRAKAAAG